MKIAVVKYNAGNIYSVDYALKRLGVEATITSDKEVLMSADKVIFPFQPESGEKCAGRVPGRDLWHLPLLHP